MTEREEDEADYRQKQPGLSQEAPSTGLSSRVGGRLQPQWCCFLGHGIGLVGRQKNET